MTEIIAARTHWTRAEIAALFDAPLLDLLLQAQQVHRAHHPTNQIQRSTLLSKIRGFRQHRRRRRCGPVRENRVGGNEWLTGPPPGWLDPAQDGLDPGSVSVTNVSKEKVDAEPGSA